MPGNAKSSGVKNTAAKSSSRWVAGMVAGNLLGFAIAVLTHAPAPAMITAILVGGAIGAISFTGQGQKHKKVAPLQDKRIRAYVFEALAETSKKLDEIIIEEEFNGAAGGGESDRRAMKQEAKPKLAIPMPAPPKMGGMM